MMPPHSPHRNTLAGALDRSLMDRVQLDHWLSVRVTLPRMGLGSREEVMGIEIPGRPECWAETKGLVLLSI